MTDIVVEDITVLVPALSAAARWVQMAVPMRIHDVVGAEKTRQGATHDGLIEHLLNPGHARENIVADVTFAIKNGFDLVRRSSRASLGLHPFVR